MNDTNERKALEAMIQKAYEHGYARGHGHAETGEPFEPADAATQYMNTPPRAVREALAASEPTAPAIPQTQKALPDGRRRCQHWYGDHTKAVQCNREWGHPERYHRAVGNGLEWEDGDDTDNEGRPTAPSEPTAPRHHVYQDGLTLSGTGKTVPHAGVTTHTSEPRTFELKQTWTIRGSGLHLLTTFDGRTIWDGPPPLPYSPTDTEAETDNRVPEPTGVGEVEPGSDLDIGLRLLELSGWVDDPDDVIGDAIDALATMQERLATHTQRPEPTGPRFVRTIVCSACAMEDDEPLTCDSPSCDGHPRFITAEQVAPTPGEEIAAALRRETREPDGWTTEEEASSLRARRGFRPVVSVSYTPTDHHRVPIYVGTEGTPTEDES